MNDGGDTMAKYYLALVGLMYLGLGIWCAVAPRHTSQAVGFSLAPGKGQSEFLTVYGGLEVGLGLIFLLALIKPEQVGILLLACLILHAALVVFRSAGFVLYSGFPRVTYILAGGEWLLLICTALLYWRYE